MKKAAYSAGRLVVKRVAMMAVKMAVKMAASLVVAKVAPTAGLMAVSMASSTAVQSMRCFSMGITSTIGVQALKTKTHISIEKTNIEIRHSERCLVLS